MKVLDRYLIRELFIPVLYGSLILIFLILIADLFDNLDELLRHGTPIPIIVEYYLSLIPYAFTQTISWATWLATLFLFVNFGFHNETTAMKAAGLQIGTIIRPVLFLGFLIGIIVFLVSDRVVPNTYRNANELRETYINKKQLKQEEKLYFNVTYYAAQDKLCYFRSFSREQGKVEDAVILWLGNLDVGHRKKIVAKEGFWKDTIWEFKDVTEYQMDSRGRILGEPRAHFRKTYPEIDFSPSELAAASSDSPYLSYRELKKSIRKLKENDVDVHSETVDLQARLATPWNSLVMMLIVIPFLARTGQRKVIAYNVLFCVGLAFAFHVTGAVGMALGKAGKLSPFFAAWASHILFGAGSLIYLDRANY